MLDTLNRAAQAWWRSYAATVADDAPPWTGLTPDDQARIRDHVAPIVAATLTADTGESVLPGLIVDLAATARARDVALTELARTRAALDHATRTERPTP